MRFRLMVVQIDWIWDLSLFGVVRYVPCFLSCDDLRRPIW